MRRKGNPRALLVGMQTGAATVESSMKIPQKTKYGTAFDPAIPLLGIYAKKPKTPIWKNMRTPVCIAALLTIAKLWKQPKCPPIDKRIKKLRYIYAKWNKSGRERQKPYDFTLCGI